MKNIKWIYIIAALIILCIILFFWYGESYFATTRKINDQKIANLATTIGAVISSLTLFLLVKQLIEMESARKAEHTPYIFFVTEQLKYHLKDVFEFWGGSDRVLITEQLDYFEGSQSLTKPKLKILNAGKGIAFKVDVAWSFDEEEVDAFLEEKFPAVPWHFVKGHTLNNLFSIPPDGNYQVNAPYKYLLWLVYKGASDKNVLNLKIKYQYRFGEKFTREFEIYGFTIPEYIHFDVTEKE